MALLGHIPPRFADSSEVLNAERSARTSGAHSHGACPIGGLGGLIGLGGGEFRLPLLMYGIGFEARSAGSGTFRRTISGK
jgi:hypothetical protein